MTAREIVENVLRRFFGPTIYGYSNAKAGAIKSYLLSKDFMIDAISVDTINGMIELMKKTRYGDYINDEIINLPLVKEINGIVSSILVDKFNEKEYGGTGEAFLIEDISNTEFFKNRIILAGGINEKNILHILSKIRPYAIDISSGVEKEKGIKDNTLIENFFKVFNQYCLSP
ncbi:MAG: hypothetical protein QXI89_01980 [Candidatus Anstonellales archaeon]